MPESRPNEIVDHKRRKLTFLAVATGLLTGLVTTQKGVEAGGAILTVISEGVRFIFDRAGDLTHRLDLLRKLFRVSGTLHIPAPKEHPLYHKPSPHDIAAMAVPGSMYTNPATTASLIKASLAPVDTLFVVGSPLNSVLTAMFIPVTNVRVAHKVRPVLNERLVPYHFLGGSSACLLVKSSTGQGAERWVYNNGLVNRGTPWHPIELASRSDWLQTDFLLVTVLPWNRGGGRAVFSCGGHGPGTSALDMLLHPAAFPLSELERLVKDLDGAEAFQVVFEVSVKHDGVYSMPSSIRIASALPPRRLESVGALFSKSDDEIFETISEALWTS